MAYLTTALCPRAVAAFNPEYVVIKVTTGTNILSMGNKFCSMRYNKVGSGFFNIVGLP